MYNQYMPNSPYGQNYMSPYQSRLEALQQPQNNRYEITRVNGKNGADAFPMPPNSSILLLDESAPIVWLKQTDGAGYATSTPYQIAPYQAAPEPDFNSLDTRIKRLEEIINAKSYVATADEPTKQPDASK